MEHHRASGAVITYHDDAAECADRDHQSRKVAGHPHGGGAVHDLAAGIRRRHSGPIKRSDPERMQIVQSGLDKKDLLQAA